MNNSFLVVKAGVLFDIIEDFLMTYAEILFMSYLVIGIMPVFFIQTEFNAPYFFAFKYLLIPVTILCYSSILILSEWRRNSSLVMLFVWPVVMSLLLTLGSGGYLMIINLFGTQNRIYSGKIIDKRISAGSNPTHLIVIHDDKLNKEVTLEATMDEHMNAKRGIIYTKKWKEGILGFPYKMVWE